MTTRSRSGSSRTQSRARNSQGGYQSGRNTGFRSSRQSNDNDYYRREGFGDFEGEYEGGVRSRSYDTDYELERENERYPSYGYESDEDTYNDDYAYANRQGEGRRSYASINEEEDRNIAGRQGRWGWGSGSSEYDEDRGYGNRLRDEDDQRERSIGRRNVWSSDEQDHEGGSRRGTYGWNADEEEGGGYGRGTSRGESSRRGFTSMDEDRQRGIYGRREGSSQRSGSSQQWDNDQSRRYGSERNRSRWGSERNGSSRSQGSRSQGDRGYSMNREGGNENYRRGSQSGGNRRRTSGRTRHSY